jgi:hypothetical protein
MVGFMSNKKKRNLSRKNLTFSCLALAAGALFSLWFHNGMFLTAGIISWALIFIISK